MRAATALAVVAVALSFEAQAECVCRCVNGEVRALCSSSLDIRPICAPTISRSFRHPSHRYHRRAYHLSAPLHAGRFK